jgi:hypothetical protein
MTLRRIVLLLVLCVVLLPIRGASADTGTSQNDPLGTPYFFSQHTGHLPLTRLDPDCKLDQTTDRKLQVAATCGEPLKHNRYQVLAHNWDCSLQDGCPGLDWGGYDGINAGIANLRRYDPVQLFDGYHLWQGVVIYAEYISDQSITPQDEFRCSTGVCGTAVVSFGPWLSTPNRMGYFLVRIAYQ